MYTCIPAYMHTCIHAYMHTCMHACIHTYIHAYMHTYIYIYIYIYKNIYLYNIHISCTYIIHAYYFYLIELGVHLIQLNADITNEWHVKLGEWQACTEHHVLQVTPPESGAANGCKDRSGHLVAASVARMILEVDFHSVSVVSLQSRSI